MGNAKKRMPKVLVKAVMGLYLSKNKVKVDSGYSKEFSIKVGTWEYIKDQCFHLCCLQSW